MQIVEFILAAFVGAIDIVLVSTAVNVKSEINEYDKIKRGLW